MQTKQHTLMRAQAQEHTFAVTKDERGKHHLVPVTGAARRGKGLAFDPIEVQNYSISRDSGLAIGTDSLQ